MYDFLSPLYFYFVHLFEVTERIIVIKVLKLKIFPQCLKQETGRVLGVKPSQDNLLHDYVVYLSSSLVSIQMLPLPM